MKNIPYITVYKPHFFAAEKISKSGVRFIHGTFFFLKFQFMPLHLALCLAMSPSSVIGVLTHHSETRTTLKFVWFESNLSDRSQYVVYNNNSSNFFLLHGVPQGSILGPYCFFNLQYRNDLVHKKKKSRQRAKKRGAVNKRGVRLIHEGGLYNVIYGYVIFQNMICYRGNGQQHLKNGNIT